ncbi:MAG TPA: translation initiation factor IF-3 [Candidatus Paceibacterota bacterium]|nr:translation initiation factor IF-3 [Candidatus Paceibacterota bacterium]
MSRPFAPRSFSSSASFVRVNGKIRAREVRVIAIDGKQLGILSLGDALNLARASGVDLVEIAPTANPPVCRVVDYGKYRYEQAKKEKESKKHQHASMVKEVQLSPRIDPHDLGVKTTHAIDFLCEDMKVKVTLKFRGREMAHTEFGFQVVKKFLEDISPYGHPDFPPKLIGKGINVMISPLPRNKRAKNPNQTAGAAKPEAAPEDHSPSHQHLETVQIEKKGKPSGNPGAAPQKPEKPGFSNNPFANIDVK